MKNERFSYVVFCNTICWSGNEWMGGSNKPVAVFSTKVEATKYAASQSTKSSGDGDVEYYVERVSFMG